MQKKILISLLLIILLILINGCTKTNTPVLCKECIEEYHSVFGCIETGKQLCPDGRCIPENETCNNCEATDFFPQ